MKNIADNRPMRVVTSMIPPVSAAMIDDRLLRITLLANLYDLLAPAIIASHRDVYRTTATSHPRVSFSVDLEGLDDLRESLDDLRESLVAVLKDWGLRG
jgi:hypothetical protein